MPEEPPGALIFADGSGRLLESGDTSAWSGTGDTAASESATRYEARIREIYTYGGKGGRGSSDGSLRLRDPRRALATPMGRRLPTLLARSECHWEW